MSHQAIGAGVGTRRHHISVLVDGSLDDGLVQINTFDSVVDTGCVIKTMIL
jgi:hypothetical protein